MVYIKLILFCIRQMALIGLWQSGAEVGGSDTLRHRTLRHQRLKDEATRLLIHGLRDDLTRIARTVLPARCAPHTQPHNDT